MGINDMKLKEIINEKHASVAGEVDENGFTQEEVDLVLQAANGPVSPVMDVQELMDYLDN